MAAIACFINAPIDVDSARMCKDAAIAHMRDYPKMLNTKAENMREYISLCDDVIVGRALFADSFPHGAESTLLYLSHGV